MKPTEVSGTVIEAVPNVDKEFGKVFTHEKKCPRYAFVGTLPIIMPLYYESCCFAAMMRSNRDNRVGFVKIKTKH